MVEHGLGVVLLITGVLMATNLDVRFENALAKRHQPARRSSSIRRAALENSNAVQSRLASLRPPSRFAARQSKQAVGHPGRLAHVGVAIPGVKTPSLPELGPAPEFTDNQDWFNTPDDSR